MDPSIIAAIQTAVDNEPGNVALRLHLASLLLEAGRPEDALAQCAAVLANQPDHLDALEKAALAAEQSGDTLRAHGYRRLHESLSWNRAKSLIEDYVPSETLDNTPGEPPRVRIDEEGMRVPLAEEEREPEPEAWETEKPETTLKDVAGMAEVKRRLNIAFLTPMRNPDMMRLYGKSLRGGLLLYGPPGCGKTFIARAAAGELGAKFLTVGLTDVVDMWLGQSEKNLHEIFETARRQKPCVLFFDEIDALGRKRSLSRESAGRGVINQLLAEMDGVGDANDGVFVLAATNHPWDVDVALRRPGRLDRTLLVLPPDAAAREAILRARMQNRPTEKIDYAWIASKTEDFSGADVSHLCESASELAMEDSLAQGSARPIRMEDFKRAMKEVRASVRPWFDTAKNYALFANEGGVYDDLLEYLRARRMM
ncbi:cell division cycle protein 48 [Capsulimonas corticalis]|uniref:Cell division cycle protein 48 n=1 Tax=Capsulimonas corticalis TaxID=2219043 RepID=A0A402D4W1_9BACT|nr:ATP-binding protein [Capsulimonas corticalis]BDI29240.1 cell division cycle protein 48 [Capsulimonas corticalis]